MRKFWLIVNAMVLLGWLGMTVHLAVQTAVLGNEETRLRLQMGQDQALRKELRHRQDRVQASLDRETLPSVLYAAGKRLDFDVQAPAPHLASLNQEDR